MPDIKENSGVVTQITTVKLPPDNQDEVLNLMIERSRFMATQPGFVSYELYESEEGWADRIEWASASAAASPSAGTRRAIPSTASIMIAAEALATSAR